MTAPDAAPHSVPGAAPDPALTRRAFLGRGLGALGIGLFGGAVAAPMGCFLAGGADSFGALQPPDAIGLRLPPGFSARIVAVSTFPVTGTGHVWHRAPDGGATFETDDGGWVYVSNSELSGRAGGVGAIRFAPDGAIVDAYSILTGTFRNCAGGPTPWGTWLSCEEVTGGRVYECDPFTPGSQGVVRAGLGTFNHEAAAVDPVNRVLYLTEDRPNGLLYRFTPSRYPSLDAGTLEAAEIPAPELLPGRTPLVWHPVPNPSPANGGVQNASHLPVEARATRFQLPEATRFNGGEGCWYQAGRVIFSTKGDNRIWALDTKTDEISILYDRATSTTPILSGVDNVTATASGDVYVAEDPGSLQIVALTRDRQVKPVVQVTGQTGTEITGPALSPDGTRLYFSSQRRPGVTYEVTGPFLPHVVGGGEAGFGSGWLLGALAAAAAMLRPASDADPITTEREPAGR